MRSVLLLRTRESLAGGGEVARAEVRFGEPGEDPGVEVGRVESFEGGEVDQRSLRDNEVTAALCDFGQVVQGERVDGETRRRLLERTLGEAEFAGHHQRATVERVRLARAVVPDRALERANGFAHLDPPAVFGPFQPQSAERHVCLRLVREMAGGVAKAQHRAFDLSVARVAKRQGHLAAAAGIEGCERFELPVAFGEPLQATVGFSELFARLEQPGVQADRFLQGRDRLRRALQLAQTNTQQVVRLGEAIVDRQRLTQRRQRLGGLAEFHLRQREFVEHARGAIVQAQVLAITLDGQRVAAHRVVDVPQDLARMGRQRVEFDRLPKIAHRGLELVAPTVGLTPFEARRHRVAPVGDRDAERLDGGEIVVPRQRGVPLFDERLVDRLFPRHADPVGDRPHDDKDEDQHGKPLHGAYGIPSGPAGGLPTVARASQRRWGTFPPSRFLSV